MKKTLGVKALIGSLMLFCLLSASVSAEELTFSAYLDAYLDASLSVADAKTALETAVVAYEGGTARKASPVEMDSLLASKERKAMDLRDQNNQAVYDAFTLYYQYRTAVHALTIADGRLKLAEEGAEGDKSQYDLGLISETEYLNKLLSLKSVRDSRESARRGLEDLERKIARSLASAEAPLLPPALIPEAEDLLPGLVAVSEKSVLDADAELYTAAANLLIKEKAFSVISSSAYAKATEKEDAEDQYLSAKRAYDKALQAAEDAALSLARSMADLVSSYEKLKIQLRVSEIELESSSLKRDYGEKTQLDYESSRFDRQAKLDEYAQFSYKIIQKNLEALALTGKDCAAYLKATIK